MNDIEMVGAETSANAATGYAVAGPANAGFSAAGCKSARSAEARRVATASAVARREGAGLAGANPTTSRMFGYARVSTRDQNLARQLDALAAFGVQTGNIFADKVSGKDFERESWHRLVRTLKAGDVVVVKSIDRLGRDYDDILEQWRLVTRDMGCAVVVLDMPLLDTRTRPGNLTGKLIADIVLQLLSYVAQIERENIRQRQAEGIASAKARGVRFGRPKKVRPGDYADARADLLDGQITRGQAAKRCRVSVSTLDRWLREDCPQNIQNC